MNFFKANRKLFRQKRGLAIGTPCAPTLANLHIAYNEERNSFSTYSPSAFIPFFRRYINNIFLITIGNKEDVEVLLTQYKLRGLDLTWQIQKNSIVFLDLEIYLKEYGP